MCLHTQLLFEYLVLIRASDSCSHFFINIQNKIFCPNHSDTSSFLQNSCENPPKIPRLNFSHFQNYVLELTTKWEFIIFLTHASKNYVLTFTTKWACMSFSRLFMEFGTSQFQFTLINFKNIRRKNNINLTMLSETYLGKCNFFKRHYYQKKIH